MGLIYSTKVHQLHWFSCTIFINCVYDSGIHSVSEYKKGTFSVTDGQPTDSLTHLNRRKPGRRTHSCDVILGEVDLSEQTKQCLQTWGESTREPQPAGTAGGGEETGAGSKEGQRTPAAGKRNRLQAGSVGEGQGSGAGSPGLRGRRAAGRSLVGWAISGAGSPCWRAAGRTFVGGVGSGAVSPDWRAGCGAGSSLVGVRGGVGSSPGSPGWMEGGGSPCLREAGQSLVGVGGGVGSSASSPGCREGRAAGGSLVGVGGGVSSGQLAGGLCRSGGSGTLLGPVTCRDSGMAGRRGQE